MGDNELDALKRENDTLRRALAESKSDTVLLNSLLKATPTLIIRCSRELKIEFINRLSDGYRMEDVLGAPVIGFVPPNHQDIAEAAFAKALAGETAQYPCASETNGESTLFESYVSPVLDEGQVIGICIVSLDVTADRQRSEALQAADNMLRIAIDATGIGLWTADAKNGVVWDARMREITGHEIPLGEQEWTDQLVHPDDRELVAKAMTLAEVGVFVGAPHRIVRPDAKIRWVLPVGRVSTDASGAVTGMQGGILDFSKQRELEEQITQVQKLEAVGSLTAGVAHNFNNLLMAIIPTLELLEPVVPPTHREYVEDAMHAAQRGAELVRELMTFAGQRGRVSKTHTAAEQIVDHALTICRRTFGRKVALSVHYREDLPLLFCDPGAIEHVLVNLLLNARDALPPSGGQISVDVRLAKPEETVKVRGSSALCIEVHDNGQGIDAALQPKIFEPFVSSKGANGTGLGLSTAHAVVTDHGGSIEMESTGDDGTTFRIFLPADGKLGARGAETSSPVTSPPEGKHVLIVDDEAPVRRVVRKMLESSNFFVTEAASVEEGAQALAEHGPDLILLDCSLAGASGRELVPVARQLCPEAKILYFTGQHVPPDEQGEVDGVLQKPVRTKCLIDGIETALARESKS
jgi:two-component system cell cycle sensor histidine kinase/response regulator CckA